MKIKDIMECDIIMLNPEDDIKKALQVMSDKEINGAPIVDKDKNLQGFVVKADIYRFLIAEGHYDTYPISSIMTKEVVSANLEDDILDVAKKIVENNIIAIPVLQEEKVAGLISMEDIIQHFINSQK